MKKLKQFVLGLLITMVSVQTYGQEYCRFTDTYVGEIITTTIDIECSFYTNLFEENGTHCKDALGNLLTFGCVAIPYELDLGTKLEIDLYPNTTFIGNDRGSKKHIRITEDGTYRIDVFIPRQYGESEFEYLTRVNNMGKVKTIGRIVEQVKE